MAIAACRLLMRKETLGDDEMQFVLSPEIDDHPPSRFSCDNRASDRIGKAVE